MIITIEFAVMALQPVRIRHIVYGIEWKQSQLELFWILAPVLSSYSSLLFSVWFVSSSQSLHYQLIHMIVNYLFSSHTLHFKKNVTIIFLQKIRFNGAVSFLISICQEEEISEMCFKWLNKSLKLIIGWMIPPPRLKFLTKLTKTWIAYYAWNDNQRKGTIQFARRLVNTWHILVKVKPRS